MDQRNRRKQPRFVTNLKVNFRAGSRTGSAYCLDLSMGGLFLQTTEDLVVGEWMQVNFSVSSPGGEKRPIQAIAQIRRILTRDLAAASGLLPGVGLEFRKFVQGLDDLRYFLADRLGIQLQQVGQPTLGPVPEVLGGAPDPVEVTSTMSVASIRRALEPTRANVPVAPIPEPDYVPAGAQPPRRMPEVASISIPLGPSPVTSDLGVPAPLEPLVPDAELEHPTSVTRAVPRRTDLAPVFSIAARTAAVVAVLVMFGWVLHRTGVMGWDPVPWSLLPWGPPR